MAPVDHAPARLSHDELDTLLGWLRAVDWLVLGLAAVQVVARMRHGSAIPWLPVAAGGALLAVNLWVRTARFPWPDPAHRVAASTLVLGAFVTLVALDSGGAGSPLVNLYLAPLLLAGAALRRPAAWVTFALVTLAYAFLAWVGHQGPLDRAAIAVDALGRLVPLAVALYLVQRLAGTVIGFRRRLKAVVELDELTGLLNQRAFEDVWQREHAAAAATNAPYSLLLVDLDQLRKVNEANGRSAGDAALLALASAIQRSVRAGDVAARHGGDEFAVLLPGSSPQVGDAVAQRVRNSFYASLFQAGGRALRGTAGVGAAHFPRDGRSPEKLLAAALKRMREDKELRRRPADGEPA